MPFERYLESPDHEPVTTASPTSSSSTVLNDNDILFDLNLTSFFNPMSGDSDRDMFQIPSFLAPDPSNLPANYQGAISPARFLSNSGLASNTTPPFQVTGSITPGRLQILHRSLSTETNKDGKSDETKSLTDPSRPQPASSTSAAMHLFPLSVAQPSPSLGLPLYSATGFDILSVLARVAVRPRPLLRLGPIDMSCSFTVVDVRQHDHPIVYCSPSFCELTQYSENDVVGKNCRFLQAPYGVPNPGVEKSYTNAEEVMHLRKSLAADKECQANIINYRKGGEPFINHLTIVPIIGGSRGDGYEPDDIVYHVGFQVDLNHQPTEILKRLQLGTYKSKDSVNLTLPNSIAGAVIGLSNLGIRDKKTHTVRNEMISKSFRNILADPAVTGALTSPPESSLSAATDKESHILSTILLENLVHDCVIAVSLKGLFLYVAPTIKQMLGYDAQELVNKSISDICHPADVVPLMRELKDSSTVSTTVTQSQQQLPHQLNQSGPSPSSPTSANAPLGDPPGLSTSTQQPQQPSSYSTLLGQPRPVDLLFRAKDKEGKYLWMECTGRLFVEPGKSRKAIILSARTRPILRLPWHNLVNANAPLLQRRQEVWGSLSTTGGTFLAAGENVHEVLGWEVGEIIGRRLVDFVSGEQREVVQQAFGRVGSRSPSQSSSSFAPPSSDGFEKSTSLTLRFWKKEGSWVDVALVLYRPDILHGAREQDPTSVFYQICPLSTASDAHSSPSSSSSGSASGGKSAPSAALSMASDSLCPSSTSPAVLSSFAHSAYAHSKAMAGKDVFEEILVHSKTSWQYELQQLKIENVRLEEEIARLEMEMRLGGGSTSSADGGGEDPPTHSGTTMTSATVSTTGNHGASGPSSRRATPT